jgi:hypothetical protein
MIRAMSKCVVMFGFFALWMVAMSGCVRRSEYDAKVTELKSQTEVLTVAEHKALQLQKDLDAVKNHLQQAPQAAKDAEAKIQSLEKENAALKDQAKKLSEAEVKMSQLQKDLDAAKSQLQQAAQDAKDAETKIKTLEQANAALKDRAKRLPPMAVTTGLVTFDGKPLKGGTVTFLPDRRKGTIGPTGVGHIDKTGHYRIITAKQDGAIVGYHQIRVEALDKSKPGSPWKIPIVYDSPEESGLAAEVKAGQVNDIPLVLRSNP